MGNDKIKNYNEAISILKIWMVMSIVICHFLDGRAEGVSKVFTQYGNVGVPVLFFLSFYLNDFTQKKLIKKRLRRLITPHLFFAVLYFVVYGMIITPSPDVYVCVGGDMFCALFFQICFGASLNPPMWFLPNLIVLSLFFYGIFSRLDVEKGDCIIIILAGVALWLQYSGVNYFLFRDMPEYMKWTIGRFAELFPIAAMGSFFSHYKLIERIRKHKKIAGIGCVITLYMEYKFNMLTGVEGFGYQGIYFLMIPICLVVLFNAIPFDKLPIYVKRMFNKWSCYNLGIIAIHYMVKLVLYGNVLDDIQRLTLIKALLLYAVCLIICIIATKIPIKFIKNSFT